jgi:hypothetical protein
MMRCDQCKYWAINKDNEQLNRFGLGECIKTKPFWECSEWNSMDDNDYLRVLKPEFAELKMFVQDGSDYTAHLYTAPDFGCIHFEEI